MPSLILRYRTHSAASRDSSPPRCAAHGRWRCSPPSRPAPLLSSPVGLSHCEAVGSSSSVRLPAGLCPTTAGNAAPSRRLRAARAASRRAPVTHSLWLRYGIYENDTLSVLPDGCRALSPSIRSRTKCPCVRALPHTPLRGYSRHVAGCSPHNAPQSYGLLHGNAPSPHASAPRPVRHAHRRRTQSHKVPMPPYPPTRLCPAAPS